METSKMTISEIVDWLTSGEMSIVAYNNYAYVISSYRIGEETFDYGIYDKLPLAEVESGQGVSVIDCIPECFIDEWVRDCLYEADHGFPEEAIKELEKTAISDWWKVLEKYDITDAPYHIVELSKIFGEVMQAKPEVISDKGSPQEIECCKLYDKKYEEN